MKKFIKTFIKLISIFILLILAQMLLLKTFLNHKDKLNISKDKKVLILGDSQTEAALNDSIINISINYSNSGDPIFFNYVKLKKIVSKNIHIKKIVLGFTPNNLNSRGFYEVPKMKNKYINYFHFIDGEDYIDIIKYNYEGFIRGITGLSKIMFKTYKIGGYRSLPSDNNKLEKDVIKNQNKFYKRNPDKVSIKYFLK